ncbi:MAG: response regulator [Acidobacteria bacterium]|nr:response regulator [Acidobacteriota bacterium]
MLTQETILTQAVEAMNNSCSKTILVAEDNKDSRAMLRFFLEDLGYKVIEAENGKEAVEAAIFFLPDLILMDLNMPELNGIDATEQIRQHNKLCDVPIIANSAEGDRGIDLFLNIDNFGEGFIGYIAKPINLDDLSEQIEMALLVMRKSA